MEFYGITAICGAGPACHLGEGMPKLLTLGDQKVLPVFGVDAKLRAFVGVHRALEAAGTEAFEPVLLGETYFDVAEKISAAVEAGEVELVVFDPVLNAEGWWVSETFEWPAEKFCDFFTAVRPVVEDVARRREDIPADRQPNPEALDKALDWYMGRMVAYIHGPSRMYSELKQLLDLKD